MSIFFLHPGTDMKTDFINHFIILIPKRPNFVWIDIFSQIFMVSLVGLGLNFKEGRCNTLCFVNFINFILKVKI